MSLYTKLFVTDKVWTRDEPETLPATQPLYECVLPGLSVSRTEPEPGLRSYPKYTQPRGWTTHVVFFPPSCFGKFILIL